MNPSQDHITNLLNRVERLMRTYGALVPYVEGLVKQVEEQERSQYRQRGGSGR